MQPQILAFVESKVRSGAYAGGRALVDRAGATLADVTVGTLGDGLSAPLVRDALFSLESISKVVCTAPVVLALVERGVMGLDQSIDTWVPEMRGTAKAALTPRQILSHSSGLPDVDDVVLDPALAPNDLWRQILDAAPRFAPGTRVYYSDLAYLILGRAVAAAAGKPLDALARELFWEPLGMQDTCFNPPADLAARLTANRSIRGRCVDPVDRALGGVVGCDGVFSTAEDLRRFGRMMLGEGALEGKRVLRPESVHELVRDQTPFASADASIAHDFDYLYSARKALGWELPGGSHSHGGTGFSPRAYGKVGGTGTFLWIDPSRALVAIYLTNHGQPVPFSKDGWAALLAEVDSRAFFERVTREPR